MQQTEVNQFLQSLRGAQPLIVLAYLLVRQAMTIEELEIRTGLDNDTVRKAVKGLAGKGMLIKQVGEHGRTTWLPMGDTLFAKMSQNPKFSDSAPDSCSSSRVNLKSLPIVKEQEEEAPESEVFGLCLTACDEAGIREPKRSRIARLPHVTPELIRAHVKQGNAEHVALGTVIYRIENDWPVLSKYLDRADGEIDPAEEAAKFTGHQVGCRCIDCQIIRSANGDTRVVCQECKHYHCTCDDDESEEL